MNKKCEKPSSHSEEELEEWAQPLSARAGSQNTFRNKNRVKWTPEENFKYCIFLGENIEVF